MPWSFCAHGIEPKKSSALQVLAPSQEQSYRL